MSHKIFERAAVSGGTILVLSSLILLGCSESERVTKRFHAGDLGGFILQSVTEYGGHVLNTNDLTRLQGEWWSEVTTGGEYQGDGEQLRIKLKVDRYQDLTNYLAHALGQPSVPIASSSSGVPCGCYTIKDIGVGLQFYPHDTETDLILVGVRKRTR